MFLDGSLAVLACALLVQEVLRSYLMLMHGETADCGGTPCWRAALMLPMQLVYLPSCAVAGLAAHSGSLGGWCDACEKERANLGVAGRSIVLLFYLLTVGDFAYHYALGPSIVVLRDVMLAHHVVVLLGHVYATAICPPGSRPCFVVAISLLEFGSAGSNIFYLTERKYPTVAAAVLLGLQTLSHLGAGYATIEWNARARRGGAWRLARWLPMAVWFTLFFMRQKEAVGLSMGWQPPVRFAPPKMQP